MYLYIYTYSVYIAVFFFYVDTLNFKICDIIFTFNHFFVSQFANKYSTETVPLIQMYICTQLCDIFIFTVSCL